MARFGADHGAKDEERVALLVDSDADADGKSISHTYLDASSIGTSRWSSRAARADADMRTPRSSKSAVVALVAGAVILLASSVALGLHLTLPLSARDKSTARRGFVAPDRRWNDHKSASVHLGPLQGPSDDELALARDAGRPAVRDQCPQVEPLVPSSRPDLDLVYSALYGNSNEEATYVIAEKLAGMVRINTEVFDDMKSAPPPEPEDDDPRRLGLYTIREYLANTWPAVHKKLTLEVVNRYSLVYTWQGSDSSLKPLMLTAHLDTVPVPAETLDRWTYPPFSGLIADGHVWGRGSVDCKSQVTALMDSVDALASNGFEPRRTVILAFGHDEEISGPQGAAAIARHLEAKHGRGSMELILDEGSGIDEYYGATFAAPAVSEKGYTNVDIFVSTAGGHSSVPPDHTGIGKLSQLIVALEAHPFKPTLGYNKETEPILVDTLRCAAEYGTTMPANLYNAIKDIDRTSGIANERAKHVLAGLLAADNPIYKALISTTQAVDLVSGGVKVNALPELSQATVNYRVSTASTVAETELHIFSALAPTAIALNMTLKQITFNGEERQTHPAPGTSDEGTILVQTDEYSLDPSPRTSATSAPFRVFAGTARHTLARPAEPFFVAPSSSTGNTDTKYYHGLSTNILRFSPVRNALPDRCIHTVDENADVRDLQAAAGFFFELIRNMDEADF